MARRDWSDYSASEIQAALLELRDQGAAAVSGLLDTHQWADLAGSAGLRVAAPFGNCQYRIACIDAEPSFVVARFDLAALEAAQRSVRQLRHRLSDAAGADSAVGDLCVVGVQAWAVLQDAEAAERSGPPCEFVQDWEAPDPTVQSASVAALRLDAVVARVYKVSRAEAQVAITHSFVFVDFQPAVKTSRLLHPGNLLVFRGKGRVSLQDAIVNTRSGRTNIRYLFWPV